MVLVDAVPICLLYGTAAVYAAHQLVDRTAAVYAAHQLVDRTAAVYAAHPSIIPHVSVNRKCRDAVCLVPSYTAHSSLQPGATCCSELLVVPTVLSTQ